MKAGLFFEHEVMTVGLFFEHEVMTAGLFFQHEVMTVIITKLPGRGHDGGS